ncbi:MobA-like NTP transferase protein [Thermodesulfitimonas autotrophica]|uniref:MobA-like NTP transferase protein n=1 Tax=Thermodesulfitimonas autotrophica TaxID=1894989 RepID=A0A3N5A9X0_9THEO|nr:nucleotidyltransferase family protein [Thermodesulfitimonas autotrophica]RPF42459.1 MobA-like NTP transferase protein [Thermodesulfitimonas autotrophica]
MMIPAVVLAGAPNSGPLHEISPASFEALIDLCGRPLAAYVIQALLDSAVISKVVVVGPGELQKEFPAARVTIIPPQGNMIENLAAGLEAVSGAARVLVATGDIPLLTPVAVEGFLRLCARHDADVYYSVVPRDAVERAYPEVKRTYVRLKEGVFTGGNVGLVDPTVMKRALGRARDFVRLRKKPLRLALVVGPGLLLWYVLGRLSLVQAERKVARFLGVRGRVVVTPWPEIGIDVDKPSDFVLAQKILCKAAKSG